MKIRQFVQFDFQMEQLTTDELHELSFLIREELEARGDKDEALTEREKRTARDSKISAIKMYRNRTGTSLQESLKRVDAYLEEFRSGKESL